MRTILKVLTGFKYKNKYYKIKDYGNYMSAIIDGVVMPIVHNYTYDIYLVAVCRNKSMNFIEMNLVNLVSIVHGADELYTKYITTDFTLTLTKDAYHNRKVKQLYTGRRLIPYCQDSLS